MTRRAKRSVRRRLRPSAPRGAASHSLRILRAGERPLLASLFRCRTSGAPSMCAACSLRRSVRVRHFAAHSRRCRRLLPLRCSAPPRPQPIRKAAKLLPALPRSSRRRRTASTSFSRAAKRSSIGKASPSACLCPAPLYLCHVIRDYL